MQGYVSRMDEVAGTFAWAAPELLMGGRCSEKVPQTPPLETSLQASAVQKPTHASVLKRLPVRQRT